MTFQFTPQAQRQLHKLSIAIQREITDKVCFYADSPNPLSFAKPIIGRRKTYRFRVRDYRIIFFIENTNIIILKIGHRSNIYNA